MRPRHIGTHKLKSVFHDARIFLTKTVWFPCRDQNWVVESPTRAFSGWEKANSFKDEVRYLEDFSDGLSVCTVQQQLCGIDIKAYTTLLEFMSFKNRNFYSLMTLFQNAFECHLEIIWLTAPMLERDEKHRQCFYVIVAFAQSRECWSISSDIYINIIN